MTTKRVDVQILIDIDEEMDNQIAHATTYHPVTGEEFGFEVDDMKDIGAQFISWLREGYANNGRL